MAHIIICEVGSAHHRATIIFHTCSHEITLRRDPASPALTPLCMYQPLIYLSYRSCCCWMLLRAAAVFQIG